MFLKISSWFVWDSALRKYAIFNAFDHCKSDSVLLAGSYDEFFVITDKGGGNFIAIIFQGCEGVRKCKSEKMGMSLIRAINKYHLLRRTEK